MSYLNLDFTSETHNACIFVGIVWLVFCPTLCCLCFYRTGTFVICRIYFNPRFLADDPQAVADLSRLKMGKNYRQGRIVLISI